MARFNSIEIRQAARINVTPIIDVALVLVIILLVTAPIMSSLDLGVDLPQARSREREDATNLSVTLGRHGELAIGEALVEPGAYVPALRRELARLDQAGLSDILVLIQADASAPSGEVRRLLAGAREAGAAHIGIATRQREAQR